MKSNERKLLEYLQENKRITRTECWEKLKFFHLPARIFDLKSKGHCIDTKIQQDGKRKETVYIYCQTGLA